MRHHQHPEFIETDMTCSCGATVHTRSTVPDQRVSVCSSCHPYYTGRQKRPDSAGRIAAFQRKYGETSA